MEKMQKWANEHDKSDKKAFASIHDHLDRLDKATNNDLIVYKIDQLGIRFDKVDKKLDSLDGSYVTKEEFTPVRNIVYGMVAIILIGVIGAIISVILKK